MDPIQIPYPPVVEIAHPSERLQRVRELAAHLDEILGRRQVQNDMQRARQDREFVGLRRASGKR
jgi:5-methylcytosine-specific restriction endonuclease McrBC regulatory subunit McrC